MDAARVAEHITQWLTSYCEKAGTKGFIIGVSGGIDSAVTSCLCAQTGKDVLLLTMPIRQTTAEYQRAKEHMQDMEKRFPNVRLQEVDLSPPFTELEKSLPPEAHENHLVMANARARLRMTTLYALAQANHLLVAGTGNKIEDFGIGFFTKYGDGGVDLSPIADLTKTQVFELGNFLKIVPSILNAKPTDGLWEDGRSDEDQIGASYPELEWAMDYNGSEEKLSDRQLEVLNLYRRLNRINRHKMEAIPVCLIPQKFVEPS